MFLSVLTFDSEDFLVSQLKKQLKDKEKKMAGLREAIVRLKEEFVKAEEEREVEKIEFEYPEQSKFPPKKKDRHFDAESILYFKNHLYIFTKSRVSKFNFA